MGFITEVPGGGGRTPPARHQDPPGTHPRLGQTPPFLLRQPGLLAQTLTVLGESHYNMLSKQIYFFLNSEGTVSKVGGGTLRFA